LTIREEGNIPFLFSWDLNIFKFNWLCSFLGKKYRTEMPYSIFGKIFAFIFLKYGKRPY